MPKSALQFGSYDYHDAVASGVHPPAMFATATEIADTHDMADQTGDYSKEEILREKREEAEARPGVGYDVPEDFHDEPEDTRQSGWYGGLTQRIKEHGYDWSKPIEMETGVPAATITDGHHRLAVMHRYHPDQFIPLKYEEPEF